MKDSTSYYDILNISKKASDGDIKRAYLALAKKFHPDHNPQNQRVSAKRFQTILEAYNALKTREKRADYNRKSRLAAENDNTQHTGFFSQFSDWLKPQRNAAKETHK